jgi:hypothetical protein
MATPASELFRAEREPDTETSDSVSNYVNNQVTISSSQSSSAAGTLDASSAVQFVNAGLKVYNINFANTYGVGAQVCILSQNNGLSNRATDGLIGSGNDGKWRPPRLLWVQVHWQPGYIVRQVWQTVL